MGLSAVCLRVKGAMEVPTESLMFKALIDIVSIIARRVAYHYAHNFFIPSLGDISNFKNEYEEMVWYSQNKEFLDKTTNIPFEVIKHFNIITL